MIKGLRQLYQYRELMFNLALREIKTRYKQSIFGAAWAVFQPLTMMIVFTLVFSRLARVPSEGIPYPVFAFAALVPWIFFSSSVGAAVSSIITNSSLVTKLYFPREIFPIAAIAAYLMDFAVSFAVFIGLILVYGIRMTPYIFLAIPIFLVQLLLIIAVSLIGSAVNVFFRDVRALIPLVLQVWMYATPIVYPIALVPAQFRALYSLNPMVGIIDGYRSVFLKGLPPDVGNLAISFLLSLALFVVAYTFFKRVEMRFADVI